MTLKHIGTIMIVLGAGLVLGGGGLSVGGKERYRALLAQHRSAKAEGLEPTGEQRFAYSNQLCNLIGFPMAAMGLVIWIIGFGLEE